MTAKEVIAQLKLMGNENIKKIYLNHGAPANQYGVKVEDLKKIQKKIKKDYVLSLELYDSGISDAQYLAGLIADEKKMTKKDLQHWADNANWYLLSEYTVAWIAAESAHGWELALKWINEKKENLQSSGWTTLASIVKIKEDEELDIKELKKLLKRIEKEIHGAANRVRYSMNSFLIAVGSYVKELTVEAERIGKAVGKLTIDVGNTACEVPYAPDQINKTLARGAKKKKMARC
jgi:3-methyladenine DNA glycosylase AlkD